MFKLKYLTLILIKPDKNHSRCLSQSRQLGYRLARGWVGCPPRYRSSRSNLHVWSYVWVGCTSMRSLHRWWSSFPRCSGLIVCSWCCALCTSLRHSLFVWGHRGWEIPNCFCSRKTDCRQRSGSVQLPSLAPRLDEESKHRSVSHTSQWYQHHWLQDKPVAQDWSTSSDTSRR